MTVYERPPKKELYDHYIYAGATIKWLASHYHVSERTVKSWLKHHGLKKQGKNDLISRAIYTLLRQGFSGRDVATLLDTTHTAVYRANEAYEKQIGDVKDGQ